MTKKNTVNWAKRAVRRVTQDVSMAEEGKRMAEQDKEPKGK